MQVTVRYDAKFVYAQGGGGGWIDGVVNWWNSTDLYFEAGGDARNGEMVG